MSYPRNIWKILLFMTNSACSRSLATAVCLRLGRITNFQFSILKLLNHLQCIISNLRLIPSSSSQHMSSNSYNSPMAVVVAITLHSSKLNSHLIVRVVCTRHLHRGMLNSQCSNHLMVYLLINRNNHSIWANKVRLRDRCNSKCPPLLSTQHRCQ